MKYVGITAALLFVATVYLANLAVKHYGPVPVGFGLTAPAGVWFAGLAFTLRDVTHRALGRRAVILAIVAGAALSYWLGATTKLPGAVATLAVASALAFLASELADLAVYEPVRRRGWMPAVIASNIVGLFVDSILFLWLAFGSLTYLWGQVVGKAWMTAFAVALIAFSNGIAKRRVVPA